MDERDWISRTPAPGERLAGPQARAELLAPAGALLISGDLDAALAAVAPGAPMLGLGGAVPGDGTFALRIGRDRALLCTPAPLDAEPGWREAGFAATPADDAWLVLRLHGAGALGVLGACTGADPRGGSPSAAIGCAGTVCLLAADGAGWRLWVPRAEAAAVWLRLGRLIDAAERPAP